MVGLSWPLWVDGPDFPRVPFVRGWPGLGASGSRAVLGLIGASLGLAAVGVAWRPMIRAAVGLMALAILGDQNRLQPWALQFALVGACLVAFPGGQALGLARVAAGALYLHSGLSKLDASFLGELGPTFLDAGLGPLGLDPAGWPDRARSAAILAMPAAEVALAAGLGFGRTRRGALIGLVGLHASLVAILGPWDLGHSTIVLVWNAAMAIEDLILFRGGPTPRLGRPARIVALALLLAPLGERLGLVDSWPAHALYASHAERSEVDVHEAGLDRMPESARPWLAGGQGPWHRLDLTGWSRAVRGTPWYPQARVANGVAEWLAVRVGGSRSVRAVHWGRAAPWSRARDRVECLGLRTIRRRGDRFVINAHPAP